MSRPVSRAPNRRPGEFPLGLGSLAAWHLHGSAGGGASQGQAGTELLLVVLLLVSCTVPAKDNRDAAGTPDGGADTPEVSAPDLRENGEVCSLASQCRSGVCAEGRCCNTPCGFPCSSCALDGQEGTCLPLPKGSQPRDKDACSAESANTCGRTGLCNGNQGCDVFAVGTACDDGMCAGTLDITARGTCQPSEIPGVNKCVRSSTPFSCAPYQCLTSSGIAQCAKSCFRDQDCSPGATCTQGKCVDPNRAPQPLGNLCEDATGCQSGVCADGVCCEKACDSPCSSCRLAGQEGRCVHLPANQAPKTAQGCAVEAATCGRNGLCDGAGQCASFAPNAICQVSRCENGQQFEAATCRNGICGPASFKACAPYACGDDGACRSTCAVAAHCAPGATCEQGVCKLAPVSVTLEEYLGKEMQPVVQSQGLVNGARQNLDRNSNWDQVPAPLTGVTYLLTSRDDKDPRNGLEDAVIYRVRVDRPSIVYLLLDERARAPAPAWLAADAWSDTGLTLRSTGADPRTYHIYRREVDAGVLGLKRVRSFQNNGTSYAFVARP
ncbi:MAG: hypothetical protein KA712_25090 [Myxococcales bacterium]|nr:hypothetical protein [Myxococcales bacterium]